MDEWEVQLQAAVKKAEGTVAAAEVEVEKVQGERVKEHERHAAAMSALDAKLSEVRGRLRGLKNAAKRAQVALNTTQRVHGPRKPKAEDVVAADPEGEAPDEE